MKTLLLLSIVLSPAFVSAQGGGGLSDFLDSFQGLLELVIPIVFVLALLYFFWGVAEYVRKSSEGSVEEGRSKMIWGIVALFVMASVWGIIGFFQQDLGITPRPLDEFKNYDEFSNQRNV